MSDNAKPRSTGAVEVDFVALTQVCSEQGKWVDQVLSRTGMSHHTIERIRKGQPIRRSTLEELLPHIGPQNLGRILRHEAATAVENGIATNDNGNLVEWTDEQVLSPWVTLPNGLQYLVSKMRHRFLADTWARVKCYELRFLSDEGREHLREHLLRHPTVCRRLSPNPRIPINERTFPDPTGKFWWVVDRWIDGTSFGDVLATERLQIAELLRVGRELADALKLLHDNGIVRRELNPGHVLLRAPDRGVVLTDFELAKLLDGQPTVGKDWPDDPYRAPEVGDGEATPQADVFSWGRIMTLASLGVLPAAGREAKSLRAAKIPDGWTKLLVRSVSSSPKNRPGTMQEILDALDTISTEAIHD